MPSFSDMWESRVWACQKYYVWESRGRVAPASAPHVLGGSSTPKVEYPQAQAEDASQSPKAAVVLTTHNAQ